MLVRLVHPSNVEPAIDVTESGIVILVKLVHPSNADLPIDVTESGIIYSVLLLPAGYCINSVLALLNNTPYSSLE